MHFKFDEIIKTENTDYLYDKWSAYRTDLTDYIIKGIENYHIKKKLSDSRDIRIKGVYNIRNIVEEYGDRKPVLAIWGAGGCNDIDIVRLAKYFSLVLIDRDVSVLNRAKQRFGLGDACICVDMHFWDISDDEYRAFEELLINKTDASGLEDYINMLTEGMAVPDYSFLPRFDYSVVVGVGSQLNARFAALSYIYNRSNEVFEMLHRLNEAAIDRMLEAIYTTTEKLLIAGYEIKSSSDSGSLKAISRTINEDIEAGSGEYGKYPDERLTSVDIAGNEILAAKLCSYIYNENKLIHLGSRTFLWPFIDDKLYLMAVLTLELNDVKHTL